MRNIFLLVLFIFVMFGLWYIVSQTYRSPKTLSSEDLYSIAEDKMKRYLGIFAISYESYKLIDIITDENITYKGERDTTRPSKGTMYGYIFEIDKGEKEKPVYFLIWVDEYGNVLSSTFDEEY